MAKKIHRLTAQQIKDLHVRGNYADGGGLYLQVTPGLTKSWVFRFAHGGRTHAMGLGALAALPLSAARRRAQECRKLLAAGHNPLEARDTAGVPARSASIETTPVPASGRKAHRVAAHEVDYYFPDPERDSGLIPSDAHSRPSMVIEGHITTPWLEVTVRRLSASKPFDAVFRSPLYCLSAKFGGAGYPDDRAAFWDSGPASGLVQIGECSLIPAGQTLHFRSGSVRHSNVTCLFDAARFDALRDWEWDADKLNHCLDIQLPRVREGLLLLAKEALAPGFASTLLAESVVLGMVVDLARDFRNLSAAQVKPGATLAAWQLRLIREQVEAASGPTPSLSTLASACAVSPRHLARLFKNTTGMTISAFVADARIRQAKAQLMRPDKMIKAIAYECGFQTPAAFAAAFRKATGRSPRQYRLEVRSTWA